MSLYLSLDIHHNFKSLSATIQYGKRNLEENLNSLQDMLCDFYVEICYNRLMYACYSSPRVSLFA